MAQTIEIRVAPLLSTNFLKAYITTMRPYLLFVSGITVVGGLSSGHTDWWPGVAVVVAGFLSYGFGQALTDCFQTDTDAISSPYRPLVRGEVSKRHILMVSLTGLLLVGIGLAAANPHNLWLASIGAAGLATYTPFKRRWATGPAYNAWIVALLCYIGMASGTPAAGFPEMTAGRWLMLATSFFGYANFVLAGYFKDIEADRATGYITFPVRFGRRPAAILSDLFAALAILCSATGLAVGFPHIAMLPALLFFIPALITAIRGQYLLHRVKEDSEAHVSIAMTVHSYILLLSAGTASYKPEWTVPLIVFVLCYLVVLHHRPAVTQV